MPLRHAILIAAHFAGPLSAQDVVGTWACQSSVQLANGQGGQALEFSMTLLPNGQFQVQGISFIAGATQDASGQFQFTAQGSWTIAQGASRLEILAQGQMTTPIGIPQPFTFGSWITPQGMVFEEVNEVASLRNFCLRR